MAVAFIFILMWNGKKSGRSIAAIILIAIVCLGAFFFYAQPHRTVISTVHSQADSLLPIIARDSITSQSPPAPIWSEGIEQQFAADVYPSQTAAARALGRQSIILLRTMTTDGQMPATVQIFGRTDPHKLTAETLHAIADGIRSDESVERVLVETVPIAIAESIYANDPQAVGIEVSLPKFSHATFPFQNSNHTAVTSGTLSLTLKNQERNLTSTANFFEKSWAQNFAAFINQDHRPWRIARSQSTCTDENDAQQQAIADACRQVTAIMQQWFQQQKILLPDINFNPIDLEQAGIIADRFTQSFQGSAGRIWRQALLLDFSPEKLMPLIDKYQHSLAAKKQTWFNTAITLLGLLGLICLVYLFLNIATRGYYTWALRCVMLILLALGIVLILFIA